MYNQITFYFSLHWCCNKMHNNTTNGNNNSDSNLPDFVLILRLTVLIKAYSFSAFHIQFQSLCRL